MRSRWASIRVTDDFPLIERDTDPSCENFNFEGGHSIIESEKIQIFRSLNISNFSRDISFGGSCTCNLSSFTPRKSPTLFRRLFREDTTCFHRVAAILLL